MSNLLKSKFLLGVMVVAVMLVGFAMVAPTADAADCTMSSLTLRVGSSGGDVMCLQQKIGATVDGKFGPMTKAKVMAFQASKGLVADGIVGPATRAALMSVQLGVEDLCPNGMTLASNCSVAPGTTPAPVTLCPNGMTLASNCSTAPGTTPTPGLTGGAGSIDITTTSSDTEDEIIEGDSEQVLAFRVEAEGSDVSLSNLKVSILHTAGAGSTRIERYIDEVTVVDEDGNELGSADASDFSKNGTTYSKNIALNNPVVKEGRANRATFYVVLHALSNIDTADLAGDAWTITASDLRYMDATGVVMTVGTVHNVTGVSFTDLATSGDVKLVVSKGSSHPTARNVEVSDTGSTSNVLLNEFKLKAQGSDMTVTSVTVTSTATGATGAVIASQYVLKADGVEVADITSVLGADGAPTTNTFTLNDDLEIDAGDTVTFQVLAKINEIGTGGFAQGDSLLVSYTSAVVEDANGGTVSTTSGSAIGNTQSFYSEGINASNFSAVRTETTDSGNITRQSWAISYTLSAFGKTYYIPKTTVRDLTTAAHITQGAEFGLETSAGVASGLGTLSASGITSSANTVGAGFEIPDGESKTFNFTVALTSADDAGITGHGALTVPAYYQLQLTKLRYDDDSAFGSLVDYTPAPAQDFQTGQGQITL